MKDSYLSKHGYVIKKIELSNDELVNLKTELHARPLVDSYSNESSDFPIYIETKNKIYIPKMYGIEKYGMPITQLKNYKGKYWDEPLEFNGTLLDRQIEPADILSDACKTKGGGILCLGTGFGKTVVALNVISRLKSKTLIVVNKIPLMKQWENEISTFLPDAKVGIIQGKNVDVQGKNIVIAMLQSLARIDYPSEIFEDFNMTVIDECFPYKTSILTSIGNINIGFLYHMKQKGQNLPMVKTFNETKKIFEFKKIINVFRKQNDNLIQLKCNNMKVKSTDNHRYLTQNGWKEAKNIKLNDYIICNYDKNTISNVCPALNSDQYQIILGSFLGSGSIQYLKNGSCQLTTTYSKWKADLFGIKKNKASCMFSTNPFYIFNKFPTIKTHVPQWILDELDERGLAIWFLDNGSTGTFDKHSQKRIVLKLKSMNIECFSTLGHIVISKKGTIELIKLISKFLPSQYSYTWNNKFLDYGYSKVTKITKNIKNYNKQNYVFDMEIEDNHNYIVSNGFVVHNCHNTASQMFSKVLFKLSSEYTIGLSATPTRGDGCDYVYKWHIGDIVYNGDIKRAGKQPIIKCIKINSKDYKEIFKVNRFTGQKTIQFTSMLSDLVEMESRNRLIIALIKDCRKHNRKILVLSDRRNHLQNLYELLQNDMSVSFTYGLFVGAMKIADLEKSKACNVILATYAAFKEGVSERDLNTLILTTPKKYIGHLKNSTKNENGNMTQIVGRIFRKEHTTINPLIIDLQDNFSVYRSQSIGRGNFYKQHFPLVKLQKQTIDIDTTIYIDKNNPFLDYIEEDIEELPAFENCIIDD